MSKVKIQGNASGTGTLTISAPNTNTDRTLTLPDGAGEILTDATGLTSSSGLNATNLTSGTIPDARFPSALPAIDGSNLTGVGGSNTPYFYVKCANDQTASSGASAELSFSGGTEYEDSDSLMGTTRFTPNVAGYYFMWASARLRAWDGNQLSWAYYQIMRNSSDTFARGSVDPSSGENEVQIACSGIDYFNGTTDYASIYWGCGTDNGSSARLSEGFFGGYKLIT